MNSTTSVNSASANAIPVHGYSNNAGPSGNFVRSSSFGPSNNSAGVSNNDNPALQSSSSSRDSHNATMAPNSPMQGPAQVAQASTQVPQISGQQLQPAGNPVSFLNSTQSQLPSVLGNPLSMLPANGVQVISLQQLLEQQAATTNPMMGLGLQQQQPTQLPLANLGLNQMDLGLQQGLRQGTQQTSLGQPNIVTAPPNPQQSTATQPLLPQPQSPAPLPLVSGIVSCG